MSTVLPQKWDETKINRKEFSELLESAGLSISDFPKDLFPATSQYNQELFSLAEILVELAFYNLNEKQSRHTNKESGDLLQSIDR